MNRYYQQSPVVQGIGQFFAGWGQGRRESQIQEAQWEQQQNLQSQQSLDRLLGNIGITAATAGIGGILGGREGALGAIGVPVGRTGSAQENAALAGHIASIFGGGGEGGGTAAPSMPISGGPPQLGGEVMGIPSAEFQQVMGGQAPAMQGAQTATPPSAIDPTQIPQYRQAQQELMNLDVIAREVATSARPIGEKNAILGSVAPRIQQLRTMVNSYPTPQPPRSHEELVASGAVLPVPGTSNFWTQDPESGGWKLSSATHQAEAGTPVANVTVNGETKTYPPNSLVKLDDNTWVTTNAKGEPNLEATKGDSGESDYRKRAEKLMKPEDREDPLKYEDRVKSAAFRLEIRDNNPETISLEEYRDLANRLQAAYGDRYKVPTELWNEFYGLGSRFRGPFKEVPFGE